LLNVFFGFGASAAAFFFAPSFLEDFVIVVLRESATGVVEVLLSA